VVQDPATEITLNLDLELVMVVDMEQPSTAVVAVVVDIVD
jgi:hypothetical protein